MKEEEEEGHAAQNPNSHGQEQAPGSTSKSPFECAADQFQCHDYVCIVGYKRCNGFKDCEDGSDELYCDYGDEGISSSLIFIFTIFIYSFTLVGFYFFICCSCTCIPTYPLIIIDHLIIARKFSYIDLIAHKGITSDMLCISFGCCCMSVCPFTPWTVNWLKCNLYYFLNYFNFYLLAP